MKAIFTSILYLFQTQYSFYSITKKTVSYLIENECCISFEKIMKTVFSILILEIRLKIIKKASITSEVTILFYIILLLVNLKSLYFYCYIVN